MRVSAKVMDAMKGALLLGAVAAVTGCGSSQMPAKTIPSPQPVLVATNPPVPTPNPNPNPPPVPVIQPEPDYAVACGRG